MHSPGCCSDIASTDAAGLVEGLSSLQKGGIRPRLLIIDDGWQCTDVDREMRDPSKKQLPMEMNKSDAYVSEYSSAELEMLRMAARGISTGSSLGERLEVRIGI